MKSIISKSSLRADGDTTFPKSEFYGSATVGERGQIVLPATLRKKFNISAGDKLLVLGDERHSSVMLIRAEVLDSLLQKMNERLRDISKSIEAGKKR